MNSPWKKQGKKSFSQGHSIIDFDRNIEILEFQFIDLKNRGSCEGICL